VSAARRALRTVALALAFAFAVGFGVGSWLRCRMERAPSYIGDAAVQVRIAEAR
jgi:TRAP-type C4-dicarboxylate transport system permease small subunit